jgi:ElaB/YqjD/DUF883 family membrane-anchored ribosome-binding protein
MGPKQSAMTTPDLSKPEARSSSQIEADIRTTRARIDSTLEQLGARLNARSLLNSALDWWEARSGGPAKSPAGAATKQAYGSLARHLKENPLAALMIGAGLGWMIIETATSSSTASEPEKASALRGSPSQEPGSPEKSPLLESAKETMSQAKESVTEWAQAAQEKVSTLSESANEAAGELGQRAQQAYQEGRSSARKLGGRLESGYRAGSEQLENALEQYPLALGVGFAALGALIGVLLPPTRGEDQLLGESADQLLSATKDKGQQLLDRGKTLTQRVAQSALEQAREEGLTPAAASQSLSQIAGKVTQVARKAKEEAASAAKEEKLNPEQPKRESSSRSNTKKKSKEPRPS